MTATNQIVSRDRQRPRPARRAGFTLTELLVVIAIIGLLAGVLLTAMRTVRKRARAMQTQSTMLEFSNACEAFQMHHGRYPGMIPDAVLADFPATGIDESPSSTELALLELMGGYRVLSPFDDPGGPVADEFASFGDCADDNIICIKFGDSDWELKIDLLRIGEGPVIDGKPYAAYFTPNGRQLGKTHGQVTSSTGVLISIGLPDLLDGWGQPILYARQLRTIGPLVSANTGDNPQFLLAGITPYTSSEALGELGANQVYAAGNNPQGSILTIGNDEKQALTLAQIIRHSAFGEPDKPLDGTARGAFALLSAGADGIFFSAIDGPGSRTLPIEDIVDGREDTSNPSIVDEYDDLRIFGGG